MRDAPSQPDPRRPAAPSHGFGAARARVATLRLRGVAGPLRARVSSPSPLPPGSGLLLLYVHPGELEETAAVADALCAAAGVVVVASACWLTPNDAYPVVFERAAGTLAWVADHAAELHADERAIAVGGYRRGGALAAAMALRARDRGWPPLARQMLVQPDFGPEPAGAPAGAASLRAPLDAVSLAGVAPAFVATAAGAPLADQGRRYAERLRRSGVDVEERRYPRGDGGPVPGGSAAVELSADLARSLRRAAARPGERERERPQPATGTSGADRRRDRPERAAVSTGFGTGPSVVTQTYRTYVKASPGAIWEALTTAEIARRYGYGTPVECDLRPGGAYRSLATEEMRQYGTPDVLIDGEVVEVDAPRRLVHTSRILWDAEALAEGYTTVAYDLEACEDGVTKLTVTHDVTGAPKTAAQFGGELPESGGGWPEILSGLKTLLETGRPLAG